MATRGPWLYLASFICFSCPPSPSRLWSCPAALNECFLRRPFQGHLVSVSRPCTLPRSRIVSLSHRWWKKKRCRLSHTSLPPFQFKSTRRWERMKTKWAGEMFTGSDGEIRDKARCVRPYLCPLVTATITPPCLPQESNGLCMRPLRGPVSFLPGTGGVCTGSFRFREWIPLRDQGLWRLRLCSLWIFFCKVILTALLKHLEKIVKGLKNHRRFSLQPCSVYAKHHIRQFK